MEIPEKCTVLVIGGGPGGSYAASVLARENIETVLLEADKVPRYHVGESMLPSFRHYLKFIDLQSKFDKYGFTPKHGAAFKMSPHYREGFTNFRDVNEENWAWNVVRSEADEIMYKHAGESGAQTFDGVKVTSINFDESNAYVKPESETSLPHIGRPVSASWHSKATGASGTIKFNYLVDASGRNGLLSTKYLRNRSYSKALKNVANWTYFSGGGIYGTGTEREGVPFFEALRDESGWAWFIPLHNGTHSVGIVMNQDIATKKKKEKSQSSQEFFDEAMQLAPMTLELLGLNAKQETGIHTGADFSYNAKAYAIPYARIVGDAGCFIDPFFSSGVHLAVTSALSAGTTIAASIRGDCNETSAAQWHSTRVRESYARFLMVVLSAYQQMRNQNVPVLSQDGEDNFDKAFTFFKPFIQGHADATQKFSRCELDKTIDFLATTLGKTSSAPNNKLNPEDMDPMDPCASVMDKEPMLVKGDVEAMKALPSHNIEGELMGFHGFGANIINGRSPRLERGNLTLVEVGAGA